MIRVLIVVALLLIGAPAAAQEGGQLWVRSFSDADGNGARSPNETLLRDGVFAELVVNGVVVASAALGTSEFADQGLIGFQNLTPGDVTLRVSATSGASVAPTSISATVSDSGRPTVIDFAVPPLVEVAPAGARGLLAGLSPRDPETTRVVLAALGALLVAGLCSLAGLMFYLIFRGPLTAVRYSTMPMRAPDRLVEPSAAPDQPSAPADAPADAAEESARS